MPFRCPTELTIRPGCRRELPAWLAARGVRRVTVASDPGLAATPWPGQLLGLLREAGLAVELWDDVSANPRDHEVEALAANLRAGGAEAVVGLGGGSVLDAAKAACLLAVHPGRLADYAGRDRFSGRGLPFLALPTTCGTGSEVTWVSVVTVVEERSKISVKGHAMFPAAAFVDADFLGSLPASLVAWTGMDALTHALEATTGRLANPASDALAERAIELLMRFLPRAAATIGRDVEAREAVAAASTLAGLAFGSADVGAVHCLSETLGGLYDVPHGLANALLLVPTLCAHGAAVTARLAALERVLTGTETAAPVAERAARGLAALAALGERLALPAASSLKIVPADLPEIARRAVANGSNGANPRPMDAAAYLAILEPLLAGERPPAPPNP